MSQHSFLFSPGAWSGEGKITLNMVEEELLFSTNWMVQTRDFSGKITGVQEIKIQGLSESMRNELTFYDIQNNTFSVDMENQNVGRIVGTGVFDDKTIAWEFRNNDMHFEGYESYRLQEDGSYLMKGEYVTSDQLRTQIQARVWNQSKGMPAADPGAQEAEGEDDA